MSLRPREKRHYYVFLASPGDVNTEREAVRAFFGRVNATFAQFWNVHFELVDWENYATIGIGRPQQLITEQTLERFRDSLVLVIGIMGQRFGSPTGVAESGTEEEFNWALEHHQRCGTPEIKWFFRKTGSLELRADSDEDAETALEQWKKVKAFRKRLQSQSSPVFYAEYSTSEIFRDVFGEDLQRWLHDPRHPWVVPQAASVLANATAILPPHTYYKNLERDFRRLDIAGIDNDRAFEIPLSEIYVRLRVMFDEEAAEDLEGIEGRERGAIDIQTALLRYRKLVIVGDPGSGKSTFLKYIALMLARSFLTRDPRIALEKLCLPEPLPIPVFLSCWDLSDFLKRKSEVRLRSLIEFIVDRLAASEFTVPIAEIEKLLTSGRCCLLFDGLDEVPTDAGRAAVSRLLEDCVQQYGENRFVVTSRVRGYTGGAILKGEFTRCDVQPFDASDRAEFVANWVSLLFRVAPDQARIKGTPAEQEFSSLTRGVEQSDRIRPLAVNPLLLTVISIVHWNRKRLPEQRVDLYDECVDVLLGQRKDAERLQHSRKVSALDEQSESMAHEERAWVRKRFAEIALHILSLDGEDDEATKEDVIKLLAPRFRDQGATEDQAISRAEQFLGKQELRSGLLVSRRTHAYRFVHLTFQEFLAAWQLSNMEFEQATSILHSRLRVAKWFETLQLLGGEWAKQSDQKADRYVAWLLANRGTSIADQAPVVALCANILKDIRGVAELTPATRQTFRVAVEATLDAFRDRSGVPVTTQLEILAALGQLGAAVKPQLIEATNAGIYEVRRRAIEMLLPHLSNDELFGLTHILDDRSREPIAEYIAALLERDEVRAYVLLSGLDHISEKCGAAMLMALRYRSNDVARTLISHVATHAIGESWVRGNALAELLDGWPDDTTRQFLVRRAVDEQSFPVRLRALNFLAQRKEWVDDELREFLQDRATTDATPDVRIYVLRMLMSQSSWSQDLLRWSFEMYPRMRGVKEAWVDARMCEFAQSRCREEPSSEVRWVAAQLLAERSTWSDEETRRLILSQLADATRDEEGKARELMTGFLTRKEWKDDLCRLITDGATASLRGRAAYEWYRLRAKTDPVAGLKRQIFTQRVTGAGPYRDPLMPVSASHLRRIARAKKLSDAQVDVLVEQVSADLGWDIRVGLKAAEPESV
jgi:hypothetical protein